METVICTKCLLPQEESEFSFKNKAKNLKHKICNSCQREYKNKSYHKHYKENKEKFRTRNMAQKERNKKNFLEYLQDKCCIDCGEDDIIVLDFDHIDSNNKEFIISKFVTGGYSWKRIEKEIAKCEIRCANCHRRRTAKQFGYYKIRLSS